MEISFTHSSEQRTPSFVVASLTLISIVALISIGLLYAHIDLQYLMDGALVLAALSAYLFIHRSIFSLLSAMIASLWEARLALVIFVLMGALIASLTVSGAVATLVHAGITLLQPQWFLPASLLITSMMSIATGTAWGTAATAGVVLMGIGSAMGVPLPMVAGAVVSGACFGDKMSVVSDTTNLAAMASRVPIYQHIKSMAYTTVPAYFIVLIAYACMGLLVNVHAMPQDQLILFGSALDNEYHLSLFCFAPLVWLVVRSYQKGNAAWVMFETIIIGVLLAVILQGKDLMSVLTALWSGPTAHTGTPSLDSLLSRGGITSMAFTLGISIKALMLGGILSRFGYIHIVVTRALCAVKRYASLVIMTIGAAFFGNLTMGEAYMSIVLGGELFRDKYDSEHVSRTVLSRCLEEGATLTTPLIPWTTAGVFFAMTLGVSTVEYLPYAWLNLVNPLIGIVFACLGIGRMKPVTHMDTRHQSQVDAVDK